MKARQSSLITRRDAARARAEQALQRKSTTPSSEYVRELNAVVRELHDVAERMQSQNSKALEHARTCRYLGDAYLDLAAEVGNEALIKAEAAYRDADTVFVHHGSADERGRLNFNLALVLVRLVPENVKLLQDFHIGRLQESERRFLAARNTFAGVDPQIVAKADTVLDAVRLKLSIAPMAIALERNLRDMAKANEDLHTGKNLAEVAARTREIIERDGGVSGYFSQTQAVVNSLPESLKQGEQYNTVIKQLGAFPAAAAEIQASSMEPQDRERFNQLRTRLDEEVKAGRVSPDRAATLANLLQDAAKAVAVPDDLPSLMKATQGIRAKAEAAFETVHYLSHGIPRPPSGSRAAALVELCWALRLFLHQQSFLSNKSEGDSKALFDFSLRGSTVDSRIYAAGADDARAIAVDREQLRPFAMEVREFSCRHHPMMVAPIWGSARLQTDPNAAVFAGSSAVRQRINSICRKVGLDLLAQPKGDNVAMARWKQLQKASVAVFDFTAREDRDRAAIAYELGIARTLGKPVVVVAHENQVLPFDIDVEPVRLSAILTTAGSADDEATLSEAIERALVWTMPHPSPEGVRSTLDHVLNRYQMQDSDIYLNQTLKQLQSLREDPDPVAVTTALGTLVSFLGQGAPMLVHPTWPPAYPVPGTERLFHVMPYQPQWSGTAAKHVQAICQARGVQYARGDHATEANVIRSIWDEINRATHVLVDFTGFNANVALELGIAHTIGRPTLMIGQGDTVRQLFPMISRLRFYPYESSAQAAKSGQFDSLLTAFLT